MFLDARIQQNLNDGSSLAGNIMDTNFPDDVIPSSISESVLDYSTNVGKQICKDKSIMFCGIVRNAAKHLERNILRLQRTAKEFKNYHTFIYENDSTDNTSEVLDKYSSDKLVYISDSRSDKDYIKKMNTEADPYHYHRCVTLSGCRNKYIEYIEENNIKNNFDYICVIDFDIKGGWSYKGFYDSIYHLENTKNAACMSAYGFVANPNQTLDLEEAKFENYWFYDTFAFRPMYVDPIIHKKQLPMFNPMRFRRGDALQEVISNFNGLGIYKQEYFNYKYQTKEWQTGCVDSEHIHVHQKIREQGGKIFLNPSLLVSYVYHKHCKDLK